MAEQVHVNRDVREGRADLAERWLGRVAGVAAAADGGGVRVAGAVAPRDRAAALVDVDYLARGEERAELFRERVEQTLPAAHRGHAAATRSRPSAPPRALLSSQASPPVHPVQGRAHHA